MSKAPEPDWKPLDRASSRFGPARALVMVALVVLTAWVAVELVVGSARRWLVDHPATVGFGVGLILLVLTVFAVERWLAFNESKRWRGPALVALDAYVFAADRVGRRISDRLMELVKALPNPPRSEPRFQDALALLLRETPSAPAGGLVEGFAQFARDETSALAMTAILASDMVARHEPFAWVVNTIAEEQRRLAEIADMLGGMGRTMAGPDYASSAKWSGLIDELSNKVFAQLCAFLEVLGDMRLRVLEAQ